MQVKLATACIGCGEPVSVTLPETYATEQGCKEAGNVWLSPDAKPHSAGEVENQHPAHCQPPAFSTESNRSLAQNFET